MIDRKKKVAFITLGCPKNTVDSEIMLNDLVENGFDVTNRVEDAQVIVINTCAFINDALEESIQTVIQAGQLKEQGVEKIIVAGCMSKRYGREVFKELPEVDAIVDTANCLNISKAIRDSYKKEYVSYIGGGFDIDYLNKKRIIDPSLPYEYIKIAEGCSNNCTFCIIPKLRGGYKSRKPEDIIKECEEVIRLGKKELILIAQDTANYGIDIFKSRKLHELVTSVARLDSSVWVRILYTYPEFLYDELFDIYRLPNVVRYMDIPIQHVCDDIREKMNRKEDMRFITEKIKTARSLYPDIYIRTSLITGFPGETEEHFQRMLEFVQSDLVDFAGIFKFSPQEGTKAAEMPDQVDEDTIERRFAALYEAVTEKLAKRAENSIGKTFEVMCDGVSDDGIFYQGRTKFQAPEIDTVVYFASEEPVDKGNIVRVKILNAQQADYIGEVVP
ncbi:MAG: 30S ribosomal protein S12 methylthiotransferase RimO [Clostridia bacterium]|jgi:ribosomal protein S12 methylthiotransferase